MTTTTRICLDMLTSARARREEYVGPWLPEPVVEHAQRSRRQPHGIGGGSVIALLLILDRLSALEPQPSCCMSVRFLVQRSRPRHWSGARRRAGSLPLARATHVRAARPRGSTPPPARSEGSMRTHAQLMSAFAAATQSGDLNALTQLLASDVRV